MQTIIQNNTDLPPELCVKPLALVGVSGLDTVNNAVHKSIWETLSSNRRVERAPVLFKLISNAHLFPVIKPKRNSYDWYIPKGIIKRNWMNKHLYEIPAVIVIFYELDWNDPQWNEKMIECASRVQSMRAALEGRLTRITVVLIQNTLPLPAGEDALASERAIALCSSCEINSASLFVLPHGDHLQGYAVRLENAFFDFAQTYYHNEAKHVKSHKEHLNKNVHQYLFVRHQFKMGFLFELKQDVHTAYKHYTHAYNNLLEIRVVDTNALEIRTIAGFINYKLCRLMFVLNLPRDAISQFRAHIDRFKNRIGFQELTFEHFAWLAKQFSVFGDIFDEAVKLGLPAVQTQHPGIYYQQAAQYTIMRKTSCYELCANISSYPQPDPLDGYNNMEFYGQRPWRPGKVTSDPPDPHLESNGIQAMQYLEKQFNHSNAIIALYGLAISQYKTYRCPRTRRHLVLQMADEYYYSKDFGKALTLLTHMLWDFRTEKWWQLISNILEKAIKCAYLTANVQDFLLLSLEILGSTIAISVDEKRRIYENFNRVLKKQIPYGDPKLAHDTLQTAIINWQPVFTAGPLNFPLDMANITSCIETKARFVKKAYEVDQNVGVEIYIRNSCPFPMTFSRVSVTINTPAFSSEFAVSDLENVQLNFQSNEVKRFVVEFMADSNDIHKEIQIAAINLTIGNPEECSMDLKFTNLVDGADIYPELLHFKHSLTKLDYDNIRPLTSALIVPRHSKINVKLDHPQPALLGEWYEIKIHVDNEEEHSIKDLKIVANLLDEELVDMEFSLTPSGPISNLPLTLEAPNFLSHKGKISTNLFLRAHKVGEKNIQINITYTLDREKPVASIKNEVIVLPIVQPFEVTRKYISTLMSEINKFYIGEEFGVMPAIRCLSPWPIIIESTSMEFMSPVKSVEEGSASLLTGKKFINEEVGAELFLATCEKASDQNVTVGQYTIKWKRENGRTTTSQTTIVGLMCEWIPLDLRVTTPAHGLVRTPMLVSYHLRNRSQHLIQLDVSMEASEAFMFAGYKQFSISILPKKVRTLNYNMYPLIPGSVALPKLSLSIPENSTEGPALRQEQLKALTDRSLPTHLYVMPQAKGNPKIPDVVKPRNLEVVNN